MGAVGFFIIDIMPIAICAISPICAISKPFAGGGSAAGSAATLVGATGCTCPNADAIACITFSFVSTSCATNYATPQPSINRLLKNGAQRAA